MKKPTKKKLPCTYCNGNGWILFYGGPFSGFKNTGSTRWQCPYCKGSDYPPPPQLQAQPKSPVAYAKLPVTGGMKVKAFEVFVRALEEGLDRGYRLSHKHTEETWPPNWDALRDYLYDNVLSEVCEVFDFNEDETER